jgi:hypothetical protein
MRPLGVPFCSGGSASSGKRWSGLRGVLPRKPWPQARAAFRFRRSTSARAVSFLFVARGVVRDSRPQARLITRARSGGHESSAFGPHVLQPAVINTPDSPGNVVSPGEAVWAEPGAQGFPAQLSRYVFLMYPVALLRAEGHRPHNCELQRTRGPSYRFLWLCGSPLNSSVRLVRSREVITASEPCARVALGGRHTVFLGHRES